MSEEQMPKVYPNFEPMRRMRRVHFVGIGGSGMSGIAQVMLNLGFQVSGSDVSRSVTTQHLESDGAEIFIGHAAKNVLGKDVVVVSTAIARSNPEVEAAREARIPVVSRAEMLAELMRFRKGIAIAGTHGKTTTTSLVASVLAEGGLDPTFVIGGRLNSTATHGQLGKGEFLVAEADESDASFLFLQPVISIVTNIDDDHLSNYENDFEKLKHAFLEFIHHTPFYGLSVLCVDDVVVRQIVSQVKRAFITYGFGDDADIQAFDVQQDMARTRFNVRLNNPSLLSAMTFAVQLNLPGRHNVLNALAAIGVGLELGVDVAAIQKALSGFSGIGRRFQMYGEMQTRHGQVLLVDDYGHHPSEMLATIRAIRAGWSHRRLVVAFQPHRFSRTQSLFDDFCMVLSEIDVVCITEVYAAGEPSIAGADGRALCAGVRARGKVNPVFVEDVQQLADVLQGVLQEGDILLTLGAGSIGAVSAGLPRQLEVS